jgi:hypothetical protein
MEHQFLPPDLPRDPEDIDYSASPALFWTEIDASQAPSQDYRSPSGFPDPPILLLWGLSLSLVTILMVRKLIFSKVSSPEDQSLNYSHATPCHRCRYFNKNPYMKCAVNPMAVQKVAANDCADFSPTDH